MAKRRKAPSNAEIQSTIESGQGVSYIQSQAWQLVPPWLSATGLYAAGQVGHWMWGDPSRLPYATAGLSAATVGVTYLAWRAGKARGPLTRVLGAATAGAGGVWLTAATINSAFSDPLWWTYPLIAAPVAVSWNIKRLLRGQGDDAHADTQWDDLATDVKTLRSRILKKRQVGATQKVTLELPPGMTQTQAQADLPALAGVYEAPPTGMRMTPDPENGRRVELSITPEDMLRHTIPWPGPSAAGRSISAPIVLGEYEDGQPMQLTLPGKRGHRVVSHILIMGMSGAGKTEAVLLLVTEVLTRVDSEVYYLDAGGKAEQTIGPIQSGLTKLATTKPQAEALLSELVDEVPDRAAHLAARGLTEWEEGCGLPFRVVVIDEGADLVADSPDFVELARKLRSVGVVLVLAIQRATHNQLPTEARANLGTVICFGVRRPADEGFALSDETIEAGARPSAWANRKPGYSYLEDNGIEPERYSIPARTHLPRYEDLEHVVTGCAGIRWAPSRAVTSEPVAGPSANGGMPAQVPAPRQTADTVPSYQPPAGMAEELAALSPDNELPHGTVDLDQALAEPPRRLSTEQAEAKLDELLAAFEERGIEQFTRADLISAGALEVTGRKRGWLSGAIGDRVNAGRLYDVTGDRADGIYGFASVREGASAHA